MSIINKLIEYHCDYPKCKNMLELPNHETMTDYNWEYRNSGNNIVCDKHRFRTSDELTILKEGDIVICPECEGKANKRWECKSCETQGWLYEWETKNV